MEGQGHDFVLAMTCTTDYGVDKELQRKLVAIRTDLDSFSDVEAYSLMVSGYLMTEYEFKELNKQHKGDGELLGRDFRDRYGIEPWLVESFVDSEQYFGGCYRAAPKQARQSQGYRPGR